MAKYSIKDSELKNLLAEVEEEIGSLLKNESERLAKAQDGGPPEESPEESAPEESAPEASASAPAEASAPPPPAAEGSAESPEASAAAPGEAPGEGMPPDPAMEQGALDPEALKAEYAQLPPEELKMHYLAAKAALFEVMGAGAGPEASAPGADAGAPPAPAAPPMGGDMGAGAGGPPPPAPAMKNELKESPGNGGDALHPVKKSENEGVEQLRKDYDDQLALLAKALERFTAPQRQAVTSIAQVQKPGNEVAVDVKSLSKTDITEKLKKHSMSPMTKAEDRTLINDYYERNVGVEKIAHLLK